MPNEPVPMRMAFSRTSVFGRRGTMLMTPPMAPVPYSTDDGPPITSMRSTVHGSNGKVTVPAPTKNCSPSKSCITDPVPPNPRELTEPPPLPGLACVATPTIRLLAWATDASPRSRTVSPLTTWTLAGVSSIDMPRRLPVMVGWVSATTAGAVTLTASARPATSMTTSTATGPSTTATGCRDGSKPGDSTCRV